MKQYETSINNLWWFEDLMWRTWVKLSVLGIWHPNNILNFIQFPLLNSARPSWYTLIYIDMLLCYEWTIWIFISNTTIALAASPGSQTSIHRSRDWIKVEADETCFDVREVIANPFAPLDILDIVMPEACVDWLIGAGQITWNPNEFQLDMGLSENVGLIFPMK